MRLPGWASVAEMLALPIIPWHSGLAQCFQGESNGAVQWASWTAASKSNV